jgi:hypothetical protein
LQRPGGDGRNWNALAAAAFALFTVMLNGVAGYCVIVAVTAGQRADAAVEGRVVVDDWFYRRVLEAEAEPSRPLLAGEFQLESRHTAREQGGSSDAVRAQLESIVANYGHAQLMAESDAVPGIAGAVFFAEMLAPVAANPLYWGAPLFAAIVYANVYGLSGGIAAAVLTGVPVAVAASCVGKALEIAVLLRVSVRARGAVIGLKSWVGFAALTCFFIGLYVLPMVANAASRWLHPVGALPWPWLAGSWAPVPTRHRRSRQGW